MTTMTGVNVTELDAIFRPKATTRPAPQVTDSERLMDESEHRVRLASQALGAAAVLRTWLNYQGRYESAELVLQAETLLSQAFDLEAAESRRLVNEGQC